MTTLLIPAILEQVNAAPVKPPKPGNKTKRSILRKNKDNQTLQHIILGAFSERLKFTGLENGFENIPYRPDSSPEGLSPSSLHNEMKQMRFFTDGNADGMAIDNNKRLELLKNILESIHISEVVLLENMFKKDLQIDGLTKELVDEVWPELLS